MSVRAGTLQSRYPRYLSSSNRINTPTVSSHKLTIDTEESALYLVDLTPKLTFEGKKSPSIMQRTLNLRSNTPTNPLTASVFSSTSLGFSPTKQIKLQTSNSVSFLNASKGIQSKNQEVTRSLSKAMSSASTQFRSSLVLQRDDTYTDKVKESLVTARPKLDNISKRYELTPIFDSPKTTVEPIRRSIPSTANSSDLNLKEFVSSITPKPSSSKTSIYSRPPQVTLKSVPRNSDAVYNDHLHQTFEALKLVRTLPDSSSIKLNGKRLHLTRKPGYTNKKTVIFDLDETLIHCLDDTRRTSADAVIPVKFPTGETINAYIKIRPYARECLREVSRDFEVIVFTASHKCYADAVLDYLDPSKQLIHHRLYRNNCISIQGVFIKDLRILANRRLEDTVLIDNLAYSFAYQLDNGIPIISWYEDPSDKELYSLINYLTTLISAHDVRSVNRQTFSLSTFYIDYTNQFMPV